MPREQLRALAADVDRLLVAGGTSTPGDDGLKRREQALRDLGKKVPALAKVADVVAQALDAAPAKAPRALLDLMLVVGQVRAGLSTAGVAGTLEPAEPSGPWASDVPARDLYQIAAALTRTGPGRVDLIREAAGRRGLGDLRLFQALLDGLDDPSAEFADLVATAALPTIGPAALPELRRGLDFQGKAAVGRRLTALATIDRGEGLALCKRAIAEGNVPVRVRALEFLAEADPEESATIALGLLAKLAPSAQPDESAASARKKGAKAAPAKLDKKVRDAAMACLGKSREDEALEILVASALEVNGPDVYGHEASHAQLPGMPHPGATARLVGEVRRIATESLAARSGSGKGKGAKSSKAGSKEAEAIEGKARCVFTILGERRDRLAVPVLVGLLDHPSGTLRADAVGVLTTIGDPEGLEAAAALVDDPDAWQKAVGAAWQLPPTERYDRLHAFCRDLSSPTKKARAKGEEILSRFADEAEELERRPEWDPRWADTLRPHLDGPEFRRVAVALEVVLGADAIPYLIAALGPPGGDWSNNDEIIQALGRLRAREAVAPLTESLSKSYNAIRSVSNALKEIGDPAAIPLLEAKIGTIRDRWKKMRVENLIEELKASTTS